MVRDIESQQQPGAWDQTMGRVSQIANLGALGGNAFLDARKKQQQNPQNPYGITQNPSGSNSAYNYGGASAGPESYPTPTATPPVINDPNYAQGWW